MKGQIRIVYNLFYLCLITQQRVQFINIDLQ